MFAGSCVAYSCCSFANSVLPASIVSAYTCLQPIIGVIFSWILNGEALAWRDLGGVLIIAGLLLTSLGAKEEGGDGDGIDGCNAQGVGSGLVHEDSGHSSASVFRLPTTRQANDGRMKAADACSPSALGHLQGPLLPKTATHSRLSMSGDL